MTEVHAHGGGECRHLSTNGAPCEQHACVQETHHLKCLLLCHGNLSEQGGVLLRPMKQ